jgi:hypothetical protein
VSGEDYPVGRGGPLVEFHFSFFETGCSVERYGLGIGIVGLVVEWGIIFCGRICKVLLVYEVEKGSRTS